MRNIPTYRRQVPGTTIYEAKFETIDKNVAIKLAQNEKERVFFDISRDYLCKEECAHLIGFLDYFLRYLLNKHQFSPMPT